MKAGEQLFINFNKRMLQVKNFIFNAFQENTYILFDDTKEAVIIDPGCFAQREKDGLAAWIESAGLAVKYVINTHGHIDHVLGNAYCVQKFAAPLLTGEGVWKEIKAAESYSAKLYDIAMTPSPEPEIWVQEGDLIRFGETKLEVLFTPGHSAGHLSFFEPKSRRLFSGDVLFMGSIGRTDLPGGDYQTLMDTIEDKLLPLGDDVQVYPGHGPVTTIGQEKAINPFLSA